MILIIFYWIKKHTKILIHVLYKTLIGTKPLLIMFNALYGFIRDYDWTEYLVLFGLERYDAIYEKIKYLVGLKNGIYVFFS